MSELFLHAIYILSFSISGFLLTFVLLQSAAQIGGRLVLLRTPLWRRVAQSTDQASVPRDPVQQIPWEQWRLVSGVIGVAVLLVILWDSEYVFMAIFGLAAAFVPSVIKSQMVQQAQWRLRLEIRDLVSELRLARALNVTVSQALEYLTLRPRERPSYFIERVRHHAERTLRLYGPEQMLQALADEFDSPDLRRLLTLLRAAMRGGMSLGDALAHSSESIAQSIRADAELSIEEAPTRLILPMLFALFPTIMTIAMLPAVSLLLTALTGPPTP